MRELRDEVQRSAQVTRQELGATLSDFQRTLLAQQGDVARTQNEQIDSFGRQLAATQQQPRRLASRRRRARRSSRPDGARRRWTQTLDAQGRARRPSLKDACRRRSPSSCEALVAGQRPAHGRGAVGGRASVGGDPAGQREEARADPRRPSTRSCTPRSSSASARASARWPTGSSRCTAGIGGDAEAGERRRLAEPGAEQRRRRAARFGEMQLAAPARAGVHARAVRARTSRRVPGSDARGRASRSGCRAARRRRAALAADRLQVSARGLRAAARGAGARRRAPASRRRRGRSRRACASRRGRSARSTWRRRTRPTSRSCSCRPRASMPRRCAARPGRVAAARPPRHARRPDARLLATLHQPADGLSTRSRSKARRPRCARCWARSRPSSAASAQSWRQRQEADEASTVRQLDRRSRGARVRWRASADAVSRPLPELRVPRRCCRARADDADPDDDRG